MNKVHNLFPTTIFESFIGVNKKEKNFLLNENYEIISQNNIRNGLTSTDKFILENKKYSSLKQKISKEINNYLYDLFQINKKTSFYITNSWCIKHEKNDKSFIHDHTNSLISGVYYFNTPKNCGNIIFERNRYTNNLFSSTLSLDLNKLNNFNSYHYSVEVKEGMLLLFPSHLLHFTEENLSNEQRCSLSFNVFFKGGIGNNQNLNRLYI